MQDDLVARLRRENADLRERIRQLECAIAPDIDVPAEYRLTATEARIFACLASRPLCSKRNLHADAYGHLMDEAPSEQVLESHISKLRRKIAPFGWRIRSERFLGYRMARRADG